MKQGLALLVLVAAGCRNGAPDVAPPNTAPPPLAAEPSKEPSGERQLSEVAPPGSNAPLHGPAIPELDDPPPPVPIRDDGLADSGVPGYLRAGCAPLGPYEDAYLTAPGYDPKPCSGSQRMANVVVGQIDGPGGGPLASMARPIRCWPLSEKEKARTTYSSALAEVTACPKPRGGHGVELPEDAPISVGTCRDGTHFVREGYVSRYRTRFYDGERLIGIKLFRGVGKGGDCRGEVNCEAVREDGLCGTTPDKPRDPRPRRRVAVP